MVIRSLQKSHPLEALLKAMRSLRSGIPGFSLRSYFLVPQFPYQKKLAFWGLAFLVGKTNNQKRLKVNH